MKDEIDKKTYLIFLFEKNQPADFSWLLKSAVYRKIREYTLSASSNSQMWTIGEGDVTIYSLTDANVLREMP